MDASARLRRADQLFREGFVSDALDAFAAVVQSGGASTRAQAELGSGLALQALGRYHEASAHLEAAAKSSGAAALPLAANRWLTGDPKGAEASLRRLESGGDFQLSAAAVLGALLFETGRAAEGQQVLERALGRATADAAATVALQVVLGSRLGGTAGAARLRGAVATAAASELKITALLELALVLARDGESADADAALAEAATHAAQARVRPELQWGDIETMRARVAEAAGRAGDAEQAWRSAVSRLEGRGSRRELADALDGFSGFLTRQGRYAEAMEALKGAARAFGPGVEAVASLGRLAAVAMFLKQLTEAGAALQLALSYLERERGEAHPLLAAVLEQLAAWSMASGKLDEAIDYSEEALELRERAKGPVLTALVQLAGAQLLSGQTEKAEPLLERARALLTAGPVSPDVAAAVLLNLAELKERKGAAAEAAQLREGAVQVLERGRQG